jgi:hypothetical protein
VRHFNGVGEYVLSVARTEVQTAENGDDARVEVEDARIIRGLFALFFDDVVHVLARFLDFFFDARRLDASVFYEALQGQFGDCAADGVKRRKDDEARRVVDDDLDAGGALERLDVASFFADYFSFHVVTRQIDGR